ncbi:MAG: aminotransferase class V-fold PLP-dependent enzyme [Acidimicrobiales bacterium]
MTIDVDRVRALTPGCANRIHLNSAGAALMSQHVIDTQLDHIRLEGDIGGYEAARERSDAFFATYDSVATLVGGKPEEVAMVENATVAWNLAFGSIDFEPGDRVLTTEAEYGANVVAYLKAVDDLGIEIVVVPSDETGEIDLNALRGAIDDRTKLISITHIPTNGGLVNPAAGVGGIARDAGIPFLLDACQSVGQLDLDVEQIGCDFLSASGRKYLRAPRGTGFLWIRESMLERVEPPVVDHHSANWVALDRYELLPDAKRYENWEFNHAAVIGLGAAVDEALELGMPAIEASVRDLAMSLRSRLDDAGFETFDLGRAPGAIVTTAVPGVDAGAAQSKLYDRGINVSVSTPDSTLIDAEKRNLPEMIRSSVHYYNTEDELDVFVSAVEEIRG